MKPNIQQTFLEKACHIYRKVSAFPTLASASIIPDSQNVNISLLWNQQDLEQNLKKKFVTNAVFQPEAKSFTMIPGFPTERNNILIECLSKSQELRAVLKTVKVSQKDDQIFCEIWSKSETKLKQCLNLSTLDVHGKVFAKGTFGSFSFSDDEMKLLYLAEKKKKKSAGYFERQKLKSNDSKGDDSKKDECKGEKFVYEESWGEQQTSICNPVICVLDLQSETVNIIKNVPDHISPSSPRWGPDSSIIYIGIWNTPFRLGRVYCPNRKSALMMTKLESEKPPVQLTLDKNICVYSPRMSNTRNKVIFLQRRLSGQGDPHAAHSMLGVYNFDTQKLSISPELLDFGVKQSNLYVYNIPSKCWLDGDVRVVLSCITNGTTKAIIVDTQSFQIKYIQPCSSILGCFGHYAIISRKIMNSVSTEVSILDCSATDKCNKIVGTKMTLLDDLEVGSIDNVPNIRTVSHYMIPKSSEISCKETGKIPLIVWVHGGPHSVFTTNFSTYGQSFCRLGYATLLLNYSGSVGFDNDSLMSLPGKIGTLDVQNCQDIVEHFLGEFSNKIDRDNVFIFGGSHGGFLTTHMIGQFPEFYRAAVVRNPVINLASMVDTTDIPDWCFFETGIPYDQKNIPSSATWSTMIEKSPVIHIPSIKTPILLCIGNKDLRVPPSQGKMYYNLLRANGKISKLLLYPNDSHPLSSVETSADVFINTCKWFNTYQKECPLDEKKRAAKKARHF